MVERKLLELQLWEASVFLGPCLDEIFQENTAECQQNNYHNELTKDEDMLGS